MKKLLLSLAAAAMCAGYASADEVTITIKGACDQFGDATVSDIDKAEDFSFTKDGFTFTTTKGASTATAYNKAGDLRVYAGGAVTIAGASGVTIEKVVFNISTQGLKRLAPITADAGEIAAQAAGDNTVTWTGSAHAVKFTVGEKAEYGTDGNTKAGQLDFDALTITYTTSGAAKKEPILKFNPDKVTVTLGQEFTAPMIMRTSDALPTYRSSNEEVATVDAKTGDVTILAPGTTIITAECAETETYYAATATYTLNVKEPLPENVLYQSDCLSSDCGFTSIHGIDFDPWSIDSKYGLKASGYVNGTARESFGIMASPMIDLTNRKNVRLSFEYAVNQFKLNGEMIDISEVTKYIGVQTKEEGGDGWWRVELTTLPTSFSWNFVECKDLDLNRFAGKKMQFGFLYESTDEIAGTWEIKNVILTADIETAVEQIEAAGEESVRYYNLQGVEVANPTNGLYIRIANGKATKEYIRK